MPNILVVDDDVLVARAVQRMLTGYDVMVETDSSAAIARITESQSDGEYFDAVVCDFNMPGKSGVDVLRAVRAHREPPIFLLASGDDIVPGMDEADAVLIKPFHVAELRRLIAELLRARSQTSTRPLRRIA